MDYADSDALAACISLGIGLLILYIILFTLTLSHRFLPYFRLALAPIAIRSFWRFGFGPYEGPTRTSPSALATIGLYGIMRTLEHSAISLGDDTSPHWVMHARFSSGPPVVLPLPGTFKTRCVYAFDLLTSLRGLSWFNDLEWSWRSRSLPSHSPKSRANFVLSGMWAFLVQYATLDACDVLIRSHLWDSNLLHAMTQLPVIKQIVFSTTICVGICFTMTTTYSLVSTICVMCGSSPSTWPPLLDSPFKSKSLKEFWSRRWHFMFRRVFERLSRPLMWLLLLFPGGRLSSNGYIANITRMLLAFILSSLLHVIIMNRMCSLEDTRMGRTDKPPFFNKPVLWFFLFQPVGLVMESAIIEPIADRIFPTRSKDLIKEDGVHGADGTTLNGNATGSAQSTRELDHMGARPSVRWERERVLQLYTWVFLIWTGRWWCDAWVRGGLLDKGVKPVPISPLRGLWNGQWVV